ncbi:MAG: LTA synthase family protein [Prevotella sp.]
MKKRIAALFATFALWIVLFVLQKPVFLLMYADSLADVFPVIFHGLPLDLSVAGYMTTVPALALTVSSLLFSCLHGERAARIFRYILLAWTAIASIIVALAFVANLALYGYWRFPLDATPVFFIATSPADAMASIVWWQGLLGIGATAFVAVGTFILFKKLYRYFGKELFTARPRKAEWLAMVLLTALLFLPIRGGVTVSAMNTGKAYFSENQTLNHAAVNPVLSFMENIAHQEDFAHQYRFMNDGVAHATFRRFVRGKAPAGTRPVSVLRTDSLPHPDIYLIILESFSDTLTRIKGVTPHLNSLKRQGLYFSRFYANSFRTDRGLVAILMGYPAPATVSLMKFPRKTATMPSLAAHLKRAGYGLNYYYGGDADFTNMRSFLINQGFEHITEDADFPVTERLSKWGVPDHLLFAKAKADLSAQASAGHRDINTRRPAFTVIQTSSSHEPFDVPYHRLSDPILNAFAYADASLGSFIDYLKASGRWNQSLVIIVPDHLGAWPRNADSFKTWRFHVPLIWVGGAIKHPMVVPVYGSQQDIAATLLGQLGINHHDMTFSKNLFSDAFHHSAFFMMNDGFGLIDDDNTVIYDNKLQRVRVDTGRLRGKNIKNGKATAQVLFDDIARR